MAISAGTRPCARRLSPGCRRAMAGRQSLNGSAPVRGLVSAIGLCIQAFTEPSDAVIVFSPVYHMFGHTVRATGRGLFESELKLVQGRYEMDLERLATELPPNARRVLLCSPHNPAGRVWSAAELQALARFCIEHDLILISDEIHRDLVFPGATYHVMAKAAPEISDRLVTLLAPSKTFNIAGGQVGFSIISNPDLRKRLSDVSAAAGLGNPNRIGALMATAAYDKGAPWLEALHRGWTGGGALRGDLRQGWRGMAAPELRASAPGAFPVHRGALPGLFLTVR